MLAAAPSKVPFYIAGGLLAAWAVVLAINGIRRPDFPSSPGGRRGVIGLSFLLVLGATSMAIVTAGEEHEGEAAAATSSELDLTADPSGVAAYDKKSGTVKAGAVTIKLTNESPLDHNVAVAQGSRELGHSDTIKGSDTELKVDLQPGEYAFYCTVDGHRAAGMQGTLTVR
ncbi:MAG: hypothetical protein HOQ03_14290 [Thermoleophilia bacterium]|nr:hypothetical protein [Thermoleophilia bacterium]